MEVKEDKAALIVENGAKISHLPPKVNPAQPLSARIMLNY